MVVRPSSILRRRLEVLRFLVTVHLQRQSIVRAAPLFLILVYYQQGRKNARVTPRKYECHHA